MKNRYPCMPKEPPPKDGGGKGCDVREEWTDAERLAWTDEHLARTLYILSKIPKDSGGIIKCPGCGVGTLRFSRARSNGHLHAHCSTPYCFSIMQ